MQDLASNRPLYVIVGQRREIPCSHDTFRRFQHWVATNFTDGAVETYSAEGLRIEHLNATAREHFPHLLNPCECGTYLPLPGIEAGPMLSSAVALRWELESIAVRGDTIPYEFRDLLVVLRQMCDLSLATATALEIR